MINSLSSLATVLRVLGVPQLLELPTLDTCVLAHDTDEPGTAAVDATVTNNNVTTNGADAAITACSRLWWR